MSDKESITESTERIMERVRQRNLELSCSIETWKENNEALHNCNTDDKPSAAKDPQSETSYLHAESPLKNMTNSTDMNIDQSVETTKAPSASKKSRFSELAAEYEKFEVDQNWHQAGSKPKEAYMKGVSPRLSIGETRPSVLCTPAGLAQLKASGAVKSPVSRDRSPGKVIEVESKTAQKLDVVKDEPRRIHFAQPISATHVVEYESSISTMTAIDESSIVAGCGINDTVHSLPTPTAKPYKANKDGEVDMSSDEYGAHTFKKKVASTSSTSESKDETVDMSSDEYGPHTFLKKKPMTPTENPSSSSISIMAAKPFVRGGSQTHFSPVQFNPVKTSSPNYETRTITLQTQMVAEIPLSEVNLRPTENHKDVINDLENCAQAANRGNVPKSPSWKHISTRDDAATKEVSPIRSAVLESAPAKRIAQQLEQRLKETQAKIPKPSPIITAPSSALKAPNTPSTPRVQTQWRGSHNTPVVVGSTPGVPIRPDVRASNLKNLKTRWELSSLTGTPIHPDETEDELLKAAIRMRNQVFPRQFNDKPRDPQPYLTKKIEKSVQEANKRSSLCSPLSKSPRYADASDESDDGYKDDLKKAAMKNPYSPYKSPAIKVKPRKSPVSIHKSPYKSPVTSSVQLQRPEATEESNLFGDDEESTDELSVSHNASHFIDQAFEFMERTPNKSYGNVTPVKSAGDCVAPTAEEELFSPVKKTPISLPVQDEQSHGDVPACHEKSVVTRRREEPESSKGALLPYTVSFYRKRMRELRAADTGVEKIDLTTNVATAPVQTVLGSCVHEDSGDDEEYRKEKIATMEREVSIQQQRIAQATHALRYCKEQTEFRGSREEVDAQRALLLATETRRALMFEIDRLSRRDYRRAPGPRGTLTITGITVLLHRDFVSAHMSDFTSYRDDIYYFIVLLRHGSEVLHSSLVSSNEGLGKKGLLEFNYYMSLKDLPPDFVCSLEVFGLKTKQEHISHELKYRLTGTLSKKQRSKLPYTMKTSMGGPSALMEPAFSLLGQLTIDINTQGRKLMLRDVKPPLDGTVIVKMKKHATEKSQTINRGFLSMYQRTKDGLGTWTRYWCVLEQGEMRFWRSPDEERDGKQWMVLLDLQTCAGDGACTVQDVCPYPNSFFIDVWVPKECSVRQGSSKPELEKLRVMLAADTSAHLDSWLEVINVTARHVLMWERPSRLTK